MNKVVCLAFAKRIIPKKKGFKVNWVTFVESTNKDKLAKLT